LSVQQLGKMGKVSRLSHRNKNEPIRPFFRRKGGGESKRRKKVIALADAKGRRNKEKLISQLFRKKFYSTILQKDGE